MYKFPLYRLTATIFIRPGLTNWGVLVAYRIHPKINLRFIIRNLQINRIFAENIMTAGKLIPTTHTRDKQIRKIKQMKRIFFFTLIAFLTALSLWAQSTYGFRGPSRNGSYLETGLLKTWPEEGPQLLWETLDVGRGFTSPVIAGDRLYITGLNEDGDMEMFKAYSLDGKKVYETAYGAPWDGSYPETRSTPTIYENNAFIISSKGDVACINITTGAMVWNVSGSSLGLKFGGWGASECPLVFDNKIIFTPCGD